MIAVFTFQFWVGYLFGLFVTTLVLMFFMGARGNTNG